MDLIKNNLINKGYDIYAVPILDRWFEFDNQKDLEFLNQYVQVNEVRSIEK